MLEGVIKSTRLLIAKSGRDIDGPDFGIDKRHSIFVLKIKSTGQNSRLQMLSVSSQLGQQPSLPIATSCVRPLREQSLRIRRLEMMMDN